MPAQPTWNARFFLLEGDPTAAARPEPAVPAISRGAVVTVLNASGPAALNSYLVSDIDEDAGIAYLNTAIGASGTYATDEDRVARLCDLVVVHPAAPVTPIAEANPTRFPPKVVAAYGVIREYLASRGIKAA